MVLLKTALRLPRVIDRLVRRGTLLNAGSLSVCILSESETLPCLASLRRVKTSWGHKGKVFVLAIAVAMLEPPEPRKIGRAASCSPFGVLSSAAPCLPD